VVGYYHSHPDHPARPSGYDRDHAWPWYSYVIVSVEAGSARDTRSWVLDDDRATFQPENLEVAGQAANDEWRQNRASQALDTF
jgi:proteasome lid subunit RPN8/RPN11